eukprot:scaffold73176_cov41-Attheya_sp.AAC.2
MSLTDTNSERIGHVFHGNAVCSVLFLPPFNLYVAAGESSRPVNINIIPMRRGEHRECSDAGGTRPEAITMDNDNRDPDSLAQEPDSRPRSRGLRSFC